MPDRPARGLIPVVVIATLLVALWLYAQSLDFGFIWDDPLWYGRVVGKTAGELIRPQPDYHFFRPALLLFNRLFAQADGTFTPSLMHAAQLAWHLLNVALLFAIGRRLGLPGRTAAAAGALFALNPWSFQAVAWAAPGQPLASALQSGAWLAYLTARQRHNSGRVAAATSLLLFFLALGVAESSVALAVLPALLEIGPGRKRRRRSLAFPLIALVYVLTWLTAPRQSGYTGLQFDPQVALYLAQGFIYPLLGRPGGYPPADAPSLGWLLPLAAFVIIALVAIAWRSGRGKVALIALAWALLGVTPALVGLDYSYVSLAARLMYSAAPGLALLWASGLLPCPTPITTHTGRLQQHVGMALLALIALQSILLLAGFSRMYRHGTDHLGDLVEATSAESGTIIVVNFPDRYTPKRPPYPLGYWGVTLAPVSVDLSAFSAVLTGARMQTNSYAMPWLDLAERQIGPYQIDLRGVITPPEEFYPLARQADAVFLSLARPDGSFELQRAGHIITSTNACQLAMFGDVVCLQAAQVEHRPGKLLLDLIWLSLAPAEPQDTIFAHVGEIGQPPTAQGDGDPWHGILPLAVWRPGDTIQEKRVISLPVTLPDTTLPIRVGVYNWVSNERYAAVAPDGSPISRDAFVIGYLPPAPRK